MLQVVGRVLGTIVGACMGLAINHIPGTFSSPALLLACLGLACIPLSMVARAQARVSVALAIITLLSVSLCAYEAVCCTTGVHMSTIDVFLTRMGAVGDRDSRVHGGYDMFCQLSMRQVKDTLPADDQLVEACSASMGTWHVVCINSNILVITELLLC